MSLGSVPFDDDGGVSQTTNENAYRISGGYAFKLSKKFNIAAELGYMGYQDSSQYSSDNLFTYKGNSIDLLANFNYLFNQTWYGFAKLGIAYVTQKFSLNIPPPFYRV